MDSMLAPLVARERIYQLGMIWGVAAVGIAGLVRGRLLSAMPLLGTSEIRDLTYHYHLSATLTALFTVVVFGFFAVRKLYVIRSDGLDDLFFALVVFDIIALLLAAPAAFGIGWIKEVVDALGGKYIDPKDIGADLNGVWEQGVASAALMLPVHLAGAILLEPLRRWALCVGAPHAVREAMAKAHATEGKLCRNAAEVSRHEGTADRLRRELEALERQWERIPLGAEGEGARAMLQPRIAKKQGRLDGVLKRLADLEAENMHLRHELELIQASAPAVSSAPLALADLQRMTEQAREQAAQLRQLRLGSEALRARTASLASPKAVKSPPPTLAPAPVPPEQAVKAVAIPAVGDAPKLQQQLDARTRQVHEMETEMAQLRAELVEQQAAASCGADPAALRAQIDVLRRQVLVVDDDEPLLRTLAQALEHDGLVTVETACDAMKALEKLKAVTRLPDLILLDIKMPGLAGTELLAMFQKHKRLRHVPVIFVSGSNPSQVSELETLPHLAYLQKPFSLKKLRETVFPALGLPVAWESSA